MVALNISSDEYLKFSAKGKTKDALVEVWETVWDFFSATKDYVRTYSSDFELYKTENEVEVYIAVMKQT